VGCAADKPATADGNPKRRISQWDSDNQAMLHARLARPRQPTHPPRYHAVMAHLHDSGYKHLFSHAELVQEQLEAFAPPGVSALLHYSTLRLENGNYVTPAIMNAPQQREATQTRHRGG